ncbi:hypothetical protein BRO54_0590 [Geobacillus proteiniphilus]|uniref:Uncharacterized protein n=1 Tax=Geobacillus proteiniphilus TaxID=860353 RepID=A0A1Q5T7J6_9BACL|nr:hypothetical protein BRO54_0590 [Geobacillus proteiniphilus]GAJ59999.1 hypothetical protein B23_3225 [Geobacillus thermoleovorans B23]
MASFLIRFFLLCYLKQSFALMLRYNKKYVKRKEKSNFIEKRLVK